MVSPFLMLFSPQRLTHRSTCLCLRHRIKMAVNIRRCAHITMPQPLLNLLHRHALGEQYRCTRVPQIVEADLLQLMLLQKLPKPARDISSLKFSAGSLFVLLAAVCWGFENNCTRKLSSKDPLQIVLLKGIFSGLGSIVIGMCIGERLTNLWSVFAVLGVGFVAYGLSIFFYVYAQRILGAARTSAYYAVAPFIGTLLSLVIFQEMPKVSYFISLAVMAVGAWLCSKDEPIFKKKKNKLR